MNEKEKKRLFFGLETHCPWPKDFPKGRILEECDRHLTLAFLGSCDWTRLKELLPNIPKMELKVGIAGYFDECLMLPKKHPRVAACHVQWIDQPDKLMAFREALVAWLEEQDFAVSEKKDRFLPHVTLCRKPENPQEWSETFKPLPMYIKDLHLYESLGNSRYRSLWNFSLAAPFEEQEHTADVSYIIRGESLQQLYRHAELALCFEEPEFLQFLRKPKKLESVIDVIGELNDLVSQADQEIGSPFKAVSYHGDAVEKEGNILEWEMIIDV